MSQQGLDGGHAVCILVLVALRMGTRFYAESNAGVDPDFMITMTDVLLALGLGFIGCQRLEMGLRAQALLTEARAGNHDGRPRGPGSRARPPAKLISGMRQRHLRNREAIVEVLRGVLPKRGMVLSGERIGRACHPFRADLPGAGLAAERPRSGRAKIDCGLD